MYDALLSEMRSMNPIPAVDHQIAAIKRGIMHGTSGNSVSDIDALTMRRNRPGFDM
jgi:hypothetical protein